MTLAHLIRSALITWDRWRWHRKTRAPRSILKKQERLQAERRNHRPTRKTLKAIYEERHALLRAEQRKGLTQ